MKFWQGNGSKQLGVDFQVVYFLSTSKEIVTIMSKYLKGRLDGAYFLTVPIFLLQTSLLVLFLFTVLN